MKKALFAALTGLLLATVSASAQDVRYNFDKNTDFSKFKTYKWVEVKDASKVNELVDRLLSSKLRLAKRPSGSENS